MIRIESLSKSFGGRTLFSEVDWQTSAGQCIGLVGNNGVGKSTLFHILVGEAEPDSGQVHIPKGVDIGYLPQEVTVTSQAPLLEFILQGAERLLAMEAKLIALEEAMASAKGDDMERLSQDYADLQDRFRRAGGYALRSQVKEIAAGLGFTNADFDAPLSSFSGGWRMRALIGRLLLRRPDLLLLDEPTNHLDLETIEWLENFLKSYEGTIILVSHDRYFLNKLVTQIAELTPRGVRLYPGNYDLFLERRDEELARQEAMAEHQQKEIARIESFIERFRYKATKSRQVQSRIKQLDKIDRVETMEIQHTALDFRFPQPGRLPKVVIELRDFSKAFGDKIIYQNANFQVCRGDKIALVGPNGAGKSTLLKMLAGVSLPDQGERVLPPQLQVAYFAQHSVEQLDLGRTILEEMQSAATMESSGKVRDILGAFGFSGNETVGKRISVLSGGEKTRLALAKLMLVPAACLLLDEPTNHLDMESRQILEFALRDYEGAVCIVSHDRYFLNQVVERVVHVEHGVIESFDGDYDYYRWKMEEREAASRATQGVNSGSGSGSAASPTSRKDLRRALADLRKERSAKTGHLKKAVEAIEKSIASTEEVIASCETSLATQEVLQNPERLAATSKQYQAAQDEQMALMERWEEATLAFESADEVYRLREAELRGEEGGEGLD